MTRWRYEDTTGIEQEGEFKDFSDKGGTDVTYFFERDDGRLDAVSGSRLKKAKPIYNTDERETP
jgi:hypothetical protein